MKFVATHWSCHTTTQLQYYHIILTHTINCTLSLLATASCAVVVTLSIDMYNLEFIAIGQFSGNTWCMESY